MQRKKCGPVQKKATLDYMQCWRHNERVHAPKELSIIMTWVNLYFPRQCVCGCVCENAILCVRSTEPRDGTCMAVGQLFCSIVQQRVPTTLLCYCIWYIVCRTHNKHTAKRFSWAERRKQHFFFSSSRSYSLVWFFFFLLFCHLPHMMFS